MDKKYFKIIKNNNLIEDVAKKSRFIFVVY